MIMRNGKTVVGWRLDEVTEDGPVGMAMLMNPFAIVPDAKNADRIVAAFEQRDELLEALREFDRAVTARESGEGSSLVDAIKMARAAIAKAEGKA